jgi:hypothetical protein
VGLLHQAAVTASGYPTQSVAATVLSADFAVVEEWGFSDRDTNQSRSLDIFGFRSVGRTGPVQPGLILLVECKRSTMPLIFFKSATQRDLSWFPAIVGGVSDSVFVTSSGSGGMYRPFSEVLGLHETPFVTHVPGCTGVAKAVRKGKELDLTGAEAFNSTVQPLCSAIDHAFAFYRLPTAQEVVYPKIALPVCVLDAPMLVAVDRASDEPLELTPWIRLFRQVARRSGERPETVHYGVDFVHLHFLGEFVKSAISLAEIFADRSVERHYLFARGLASAPDFRHFAWMDIRESNQ